MKTKPILNLILILIGITIMAVGPYYLGAELGLALGFPFLMFGLYRLSKRTGARNSGSERSSDEI